MSPPEPDSALAHARVIPEAVRPAWPGDVPDEVPHINAMHPASPPPLGGVALSEGQGTTMESETTPAPKPGIKTTEFWGNVANTLGSFGVASGVLLPQDAKAGHDVLTGCIQIVAVVNAMIGNVVYIWSRIRAKAGK